MQSTCGQGRKKVLAIVIMLPSEMQERRKGLAIVIALSSEMQGKFRIIPTGSLDHLCMHMLHQGRRKRLAIVIALPS
jgi:hypothetical protein